MANQAYEEQLVCAECSQPIAWFHVSDGSPFNGWVHKDGDPGDWGHPARPADKSS